MMPRRTSFSTVFTLMLRTSPISAISRPPKYFNSIARALRASTAASRLERLIERQQIDRSRIGRRRRIVERDQRVAVAALGRAVPAGVVHEDLTHELRGDRDEMGAVGPVLSRAPAHQAHEGFVDERRRLQGVAGPLAAQVRRRQSVQLVFDDLGDLAEGGLDRRAASSAAGS